MSRNIPSDPSKMKDPSAADVAFNTSYSLYPFSVLIILKVVTDTVMLTPSKGFPS